ncbi:MAG: hypothetical protein PHX34_01490 [Candidatus Shapirobacteria bacterium]|nr:hypothetical protein [Candidatus Shapirobacteria bacterium]
MNRLQSALKRVFFLSGFLIFGVFFVFFELMVLSKTPRQKVLGINTEESIRVLVGNSDNLDKEKMKVETSILGGDARPIIIKKYLEKYNSPLVPYSDLIYEISKDYGFEYYWIVAIAQQESNLCKKAPENSFNCWGYGIHKKGTLKFDNYELAIRSFAEYLKREYFDKGLNTPELIMNKYCPSSNGSWAYGVQQFINELENGDVGM